jgi:hypothetical protein
MKGIENKKAKDTNKEKGKVSFIVYQLGKNITSALPPPQKKNERKTINKSYGDSFVIFRKTAEAIQVMKLLVEKGKFISFSSELAILSQQSLVCANIVSDNTTTSGLYSWFRLRRNTSK